MDDSRGTTKRKCCKCSVNTCRAIVAEFFCMFLFMFIAGTIDLAWPDRAPTSELQTAMTLGFAVASLTQCFDAISGSHLNPIVTLGFIVTRNIGLIKGAMYLIVQFSGAFTAVLLLKGALPVELQGTLGATEPSEHITPHLAFGIELILTFIYVFTVLSSWELRNPNTAYYWPCCRALVIGLTYTMNTMWGYVFTQASMNPARSLAAAVFLKIQMSEWLIALEVYVAGPVLGSLLAALIYKYIFATAAASVDLNNRSLTAVDAGVVEEERENMVALQSISSPRGRIKDTRDL